MSREPRVDAYIAKAPPFARPILEKVRERVHAVMPDVEEVLARHVEGRTMGVLGEPRVNVLLLNLALDHLDLRVTKHAEPQGGGITVYRSRGFMPGSR